MGFMETFNAAFRMRSDLDTLTYTAAESQALFMNRRVARLPYKGTEVLRCGRMLARDFQGRLVRQRGAVQNAHDVVLAVQPACHTRHVQRCEPTADMSCMCVRARGSCTGRTCAHANTDTWERRATRACWLTCAYAHGARTHLRATTTCRGAGSGIRTDDRDHFLARLLVLLELVQRSATDSRVPRAHGGVITSACASACASTCAIGARLLRCGRRYSIAGSFGA